MVKKPTPKKKTVVHIMSGQFVQISAITPDAYEWIQEKAPEYGRLYPSDDGRRFDLFVDENWKVGEVIAYLESGGS